MDNTMFGARANTAQDAAAGLLSDVPREPGGG